VDTGRARFAEAEAGIRPTSDDPAGEIGTLWRTLITSLDAYWQIATELNGLQDKTLRVASDRLGYYLDDVLGCADDWNDPEFILCELTIGSALASTESETKGNLFTELLPAISRDLGSKYGIGIPQVKVAVDQYIGPNEYVIELWGIEHWRGEVSDAELEPLEAVARHLSKELHEQPNLLCCLDMTNDLVIRWTATQPELGDRLLDDPTLLLMTITLRALLKRHVSLAEGSAVLEVFSDLGSEGTIDDLVERCAEKLAPTAAREKTP
jgi:flagellar biosynthesis component FlhA